MLPFSRSSPPIIPTIASAMPEMVAMSGRSSAALWEALGETLSLLTGASAVLDVAAAVFAMGSVVGQFAIGVGLRVANEYAPAELHNPFHHFVGALAHAQNLPVGERDDGVRSHIDMLNQIRVEDHL